MTTQLSRPRSLIRQYQGTSFVLLCLGLSWSWWGVAFAYLGDGELTRGLITPGAFGPPIAAGVVVWASGGRLGRWLRQLVRWRVRPRWYPLAIGIPIPIMILVVGGAVALGGHPVDASVLPGRAPVFVVTLLIATLIGGGQEELGWRGFLLPRLQSMYSALSATLVIGIVWAIWHFPLFVLGAPRNQSGNLLAYTLLVVAFAILLTWVYNSTSGSVLLAMLFHGSVNAAGTLVPIRLGHLQRIDFAIDAGMLIGFGAVALAVLVWTGHRTLSRHGIPGPESAGIRPKRDE